MGVYFTILKMEHFSQLLSSPLLIITVFLGLVNITVLILYVFLYLTSSRQPDLSRAESEKSFTDPRQKERKKFPFPSISDAPSLYLTLVVPAYKEQDRLPKMMNETLSYLEKRKKENSSFTYEVIIVNDGSPDKTSEEAMKFVSEYGCEKIRLLEFVRNRGKGGAVRMGCLSARGERVLFLDADGATEIADMERLEKAIDMIAPDHTVPVIAIGSRAHLQDEAVAKRTFFRNFLMYGFHFLVYFLCVKGIRDTQCGFKMCTRSAIDLVFKNLHIERWAFDVEMLYIAQYFKIPIVEVAVNWQEIEGSKMVPIFSWIQMGRDILFIRLRYLFGIWKIKPKSS